MFDLLSSYFFVIFIALNGYENQMSLIMSSPGSPSSNIDWKALVESVRNNECILVLGPKVATIRREGLEYTLPELLTEFLQNKLLAQIQ